MFAYPQSGFTLVELSIVLVIIGLLVGGVLVGQDLIHAAEIRATVRQIDKLDSSVNTFRLKYNCLPGDCANATAFGFTSYDGIEPANGTGNGYIEWVAGDAVGITGPTESFNAYTHLKQANLIAGTVKATNGTNQTLPIALSPGYDASWDIIAVLPYAFQALPANVLPTANYYQLHLSNSSGVGILPVDSYSLDTKIDDGVPRSGNMIATQAGPGWRSDTGQPYDPLTTPGPAGATSDYCLTNDTPNKYNILNRSLPYNKMCVLQVKAQF